jgi:ABC-type transport system involved in multi-copper enzyme maturation permease subunit
MRKACEYGAAPFALAIVFSTIFYGLFFFVARAWGMAVLLPAAVFLVQGDRCAFFSLLFFLLFFPFFCFVFVLTHRSPTILFHSADLAFLAVFDVNWSPRTLKVFEVLSFFNLNWELAQIECAFGGPVPW